MAMPESMHAGTLDLQLFQYWPETILHNFTGFADGAALYDAPIEGKAGKFYGTTPISNGQGISTAFSVTSSGTFTTLHDFTTAEGYPIYAGLVQGTDGNFYGVAYQGGANNYGTIFKMTPAGAVTVLHSFNNSDGARPSAPLIQVSDGNFYGSTILGGLGVGVIFKITPSGTYTVLHSINSSLGEGQGPNSSLTQATDGKLYGTTGRGTAGFLGTIFSVTTTGTFTTLYTFCPALTNCTDGYNPSSPLRQNTNGIFYGTTLTGGDYGCNGNGTGCGVVYSLDVGLKPFVSLVTTSGNEGAKIGVLGQGFSSSSVVKFGGTQATTVTPSGTTFLTATVPAGALTGSVTVITGTTTLTSNLKFKVKPTFTTFSPPNGPVGTPVTITGTGLTQTTKVTFNGTSASFTVNSDTQVTATVPTGATTGKIMVTTKGGSVTSMTTFTVN